MYFYRECLHEHKRELKKLELEEDGDANVGKL